MSEPALTRNDLLRKTRAILERHALSPNHDLGQNFCVEPAILDLVSRTVQEVNPSTILEVGGGLGTLSEQLVNLHATLTIVEKDPNLAILLERSFGSSGATVANTDVLQVDGEVWASQDVVTGNIPYEISSPLLGVIWKSCNERGRASPHIIFTVQKEFGQRLAAPAGTQDYGRLGVMAQLLTTPHLLKVYPPSAFYPVPKVAHAVVWLEPNPNPRPELRDPNLTPFLTDLFNRKNKKVTSVLRPRYKRRPDRASVEAALKSSPLSERRVKDLSPNECVDLFLIWREVTTSG